jgi:hypothetical protein
MVKHPPQAQAFGYRLILYRKVSSRLYMYTISSPKKLQTVPHFYFLEWKGRTVRGRL